MTRARDNSFNPSNGQAAGKNLIINGGMDIWQRGTTFTTDAAATVLYTADRISAWTLYPGNDARQTITRETTHVPSNFKYSLKSVVSNAIPVNGGRMLIGYTMENQDALAIAGKTITYSMQVKTIGNIDRIYLYSRYNTTGGNSHINGTDAANTPFTINSSSFTTITWTTTVPSAATLTSSGTYGFQLVYYRSNNAVEAIGDGIYISGIQLEIGNVATSFSRAGGTIGGELSLCQRYYAVGGGDLSFSGVTTAGNGYYGMYYFPVDMRIPPSVTFTNANNAGPFGATPGGAGGTTTRYTREGRTAATSSSGYFGSSYAASAEL